MSWSASLQVAKIGPGSLCKALSRSRSWQSYPRFAPDRLHAARVGFFVVCLALTLMSCWPHAAEATASEDRTAEVWLVTYGPGEIYWQRFGHNAIWIRDPRRGLDHTFNFGFFDFAQENFMLRFLRGRMLYFSAARPATEEFAEYIDDNRSIRVQRLALSSAQTEQLTAHLLNETRPENRDYRYDYYLNNCSTRVRDVLDQALGGQLADRSGRQPALQSWRDHTRRLTSMDFWLYLGLEIVLGEAVDQPISRWDEMFIPERLAEAEANLDVDSAEGPIALVQEDASLFESTARQPPSTPRAWWPRYLLASIGLLVVLGALSRLAGSGLARALARGWFAVSGLAGLAILFFWFGTDHSVARFNLNLLVFNPLWLWPAVSRDAGRFLLPVVAGCSLLALGLPLLPPHQYTLDVLAAFLPLNLAAAAVVGRTRRSRH